MDSQRIERRLRRLEATNRRWRAAACLLALGLCGLVTMGQGKETPDEIRARRFVLVDAEGKQQAVLGDGKLLIGADTKGFHAVLDEAQLDLRRGETSVTAVHTLGFESIGGSSPGKEIRFAMEIGRREGTLRLGTEKSAVVLSGGSGSGVVETIHEGQPNWSSYGK